MIEWRVNEIRRPVREADEIEQFRSIIARHALPPFTTGFKLRFGELNEFPAVWVSFVMTEDLSPDSDDADERIDRSLMVIEEIRDDLLTQRPDRFPYFTFELIPSA